MQGAPSRTHLFLNLGLPQRAVYTPSKPLEGKKTEIIVLISTLR